MTREQLMKCSFKAYQKVTLKTPKLPEIDCMLLSVDFENCVMQVMPFDYTDYQSDAITVSTDYIQLYKRKPFEVVK